MKEWSESDFAAKDTAKKTVILQDKETQKAAARAMKLLLYRMRTEKELRGRLEEDGYEPTVIDNAISYCASFGYIDDEKYAENYVISMKKRKSKKQMQREMTERGLDSAVIDHAIEAADFDEYDILYELVCKKAGSPHQLDEKELRRVYGYLARKGFSSSVIWKAIHSFQDQEETESFCSDCPKGR